MASDDGSIRFQDTSSNPTSWLPVYGRWCGPDWSAGERGTTKSVAELGNEPVFRRIGPAGGLEVDSPLDWLCKQHDLAYLKAERKPGLEAMQKLTADIDLLGKVVSLDETLLTKDEKIYSKLMALAFAEKIFNVDVPALGYEVVVTAMKDLLLSLHGLFEKIEGLSYMDQFGAMMWGAVDEGDLHGGFGDQEFWDIPFTRFTLTATDTAGRSALISYYADPYRQAHGIAAVVAGEIVEGSARTITIYDDGFVTAQSGVQDPVVLAEPLTMAWPGLYLDDFQVFPDVIPVRSPAATSEPPASDPDVANMPIPSIIDVGPITLYPLPSVSLPSLPEPTAPPEGQSAPPDRTDGGPFYAVLVDPPFPDDGTGLKGPPPPPIVVYGSPSNDWFSATWDLFQCDSPDFFTKSFCDGLLRDANPLATDRAADLRIGQDLDQLVASDAHRMEIQAQQDKQSSAPLSDTDNAWPFDGSWALADASCAVVGNNVDDVGW